MKILLLVCDGLGAGDAPDAEAFGDAGSNTLVNTAAAVGGLRVPNLEALGLGCLGDVRGVAPTRNEGTAQGRLIERSPGKDSMTGHWELCGLTLDRPFPLYPAGFPAEVIDGFEAAIGRPALGNRPASGTDIIEELGATHLETGRPIVYTSGDSVFQIACHEQVAGDEQLWAWCQTARDLLVGEHAVGRVIARPFRGAPGSFERTPGRRDFSLPPPRATLLDRCADAGVPVFGVGKISDVFSGRGIAESRYSDSDDHGVDVACGFLQRAGTALVFCNLVDFDSKYGHRNDAEGFAACLERLDRRLPELLAAVGEDGYTFITGDHGCDPTTPSTDHSREMVPLLAKGPWNGSVGLGDRHMGDLGATIADLLGLEEGLQGDSFAAMLGAVA